MIELANEDIGLHSNVPLETYLRWDAVSAGTLKDMARTASYCRWRLDHPESAEETPATIFGSAIHCAVLEIDEFEKRYVLDPQSSKFLSGEIKTPYPKGWRNTKEYREALAAIKEDGFQVLPQQELFACRKIRDNIESHPAAASIAKSIEHAEASIVTEDSDTGLLLKIRPDALCANVCCHIKTTRRADHRSFDRDIFLNGYHQSVAFYADVLAAEFPEQYLHHVFLVIENTPPYDVAVRSLEPAAMELGRMEYRALLEQYWLCTETGSWPGYSPNIEPCGVPKWAYYQQEDD